MFQANAMGIYGLVSVAMCWVLAGLLYRVGPTGGAARKLALLLVVEGVALGTGGYSILLMTPAATESSWFPAYSQFEFIVHTLGDCAMLALYPPFLAAAVSTSLTRPFANKRIRIGLVGVAVVMFFAVNLSPLEIGAVLLYLMLSLLFGYAFVVSIHAWHMAVPGIARTRAGIFALAFGFRDICWGIIYAQAIWQIDVGSYLDDSLTLDFLDFVYASGTFFAVPLIAYGILRTQLFDIDLRIRWTIKQSTVAAVFVAVFYLVSEGADRLLVSEFGNVIGLVASALVVLFLVPVQRFAERLAGAAMPNTENTPEYVAHRKMQVYEAAVAEALPDGNISDRERVLLNSLRDSLGISAADANALEGDLIKRQPGSG